MFLMNLCIRIIIAIGGPDDEAAVDRYTRCTLVHEEATRQSVDPYLALAVAWEESRFEDIRSPKGAVGPMQVIPKWWCEDINDCDHIEAGVKALATFRRLHPKSLPKALCHYNGGNKCFKRGETYARMVMKRLSFIKRLERKLKAQVDCDTQVRNCDR